MFKEYMLEMLKVVIRGFSVEFIVLESGEKVLNFVYRGKFG